MKIIQYKYMKMVIEGESKTIQSNVNYRIL